MKKTFRTERKRERRGGEGEKGKEGWKEREKFIIFLGVPEINFTHQSTKYILNQTKMKTNYNHNKRIEE